MELRLAHDKPTAVSATIDAFENMVEVSLNSIQCYNNYVYHCLIRRAVHNGQLKFDDTESDKGLFLKYWGLFSGKDSEARDLDPAEIYSSSRKAFIVE